MLGGWVVGAKMETKLGKHEVEAWVRSSWWVSGKALDGGVCRVETLGGEWEEVGLNKFLPERRGWEQSEAQS